MLKWATTVEVDLRRGSLIIDLILVKDYHEANWEKYCAKRQ